MEKISAAMIDINRAYQEAKKDSDTKFVPENLDTLKKIIPQ